MTEPRKTPRTDAAERKWRKGPGEDGWQTSRAIEAETQEMAEALAAVLGPYEHDGDALAKITQAEQVLARHRAKQEVGT